MQYRKTENSRSEKLKQRHNANVQFAILQKCNVAYDKTKREQPIRLPSLIKFSYKFRHIGKEASVVFNRKRYVICEFVHFSHLNEKQIRIHTENLRCLV